jgi:hypothetical protein
MAFGVGIVFTLIGFGMRAPVPVRAGHASTGTATT